MNKLPDLENLTNSIFGAMFVRDLEYIKGGESFCSMEVLRKHALNDEELSKHYLICEEYAKSVIQGLEDRNGDN